MPGPLVLQTEALSPEAREWIAERCDYRVTPFAEAEFARLLPEAEGLVIRTYTMVTRELLERAPKLRVVGRAGVALENVDLEACRERGVVVVHAPTSNSQAVVEYVTGQILGELRPRTFLDHAVDLPEWERMRAELTVPRQLSDMTLGILGLGRIGSRVGEVATAIGMRVIANDIREIDPVKRGGAEMVDLDTLRAESDVLTIHIDTRPSNRNFVNAPFLAPLKEDVLLINAARGFVLDERALAAFLRGHADAHAVLDVHEPEPFTADNPLLGLPNAKLAPHMAACTLTAKNNMSWVVRDVWRVLCGEVPEFPAPILDAVPCR